MLEPIPFAGMVEIQEMNNEPVAWMRKDGTLKFQEGLYFEVGQAFYTRPAKNLTDEEINDAWKQSHEDGIATQQGFTTQQHYFAHLILRKASEK